MQKVTIRFEKTREENDVSIKVKKLPTIDKVPHHREPYGPNFEQHADISVVIVNCI